MEDNKEFRKFGITPDFRLRLEQLTDKYYINPTYRDTELNFTVTHGVAPNTYQTRIIGDGNYSFIKGATVEISSESGTKVYTVKANINYAGAIAGMLYDYIHIFGIQDEYELSGAGDTVYFDQYTPTLGHNRLFTFTITNNNVVESGDLYYRLKMDNSFILQNIYSDNSGTKMIETFGVYSIANNYATRLLAVENKAYGFNLRPGLQAMSFLDFKDLLSNTGEYFLSVPFDKGDYNIYITYLQQV